MAVANMEQGLRRASGHFANQSFQSSLVIAYSLGCQGPPKKRNRGGHFDQHRPPIPGTHHLRKTPTRFSDGNRRMPPMIRLPSFADSNVSDVQLRRRADRLSNGYLKNSPPCTGGDEFSMYDVAVHRLTADVADVHRPFYR
jgi:hypothetical protein